MMSKHEILPERKAILDLARGRSCLVLGPLGTYERYRPAELGGGGCQEEWDFAYLTKIAARLVGLDNEQRLVLMAREDGFNIQLGDAESHQFAEKFDVILALHIIEHLGHPLALLQNAARNLNPGGILVVETPNPFSIQSIACGLIRGYAHLEPTHTCWIDARHALELGRRANLSLRKVTYYTAIDCRRPSYIVRSHLYAAISKCVPRLGSNVVFHFTE
ncbi:MAG TPA: class I SAM-dependent methyltransferase [Bryobacteraceae bacterium]|nr:class I SAM-dependent methyltransferase [Bryobacteraceae bacterium]